MSFGGTDSTPARFLTDQAASSARALSLKVYGGEVLAAFDLACVTNDKVQVRTLKNAKSAQFPKTWKAIAEYHTPGKEMLGNDIDTTEIVVTIDDILVAHTALADLDLMLSQFDVRGQYSSEMGRALARVYDKNQFRQILLAARTAADGPFPAGSVITDAALTNSGSIDGKAWIDAIKTANETFFNKDVPEDMPRYLAVNKRVFNGIKYAKDANGQYLVLNREIYGGDQAGGVQGRGETLDIDGVTVVASRNMPTIDESADTSVYTKYRANYATTTGVIWTPMAIATVKMMDVGFETIRDPRRLEDFMVAKMLVGHGTLRPECAIELKTS